MRPARLFLAALPFVALVSLAPLAAQDTRTVTEPKIPPACVTLEADIVSNHGNIALADEQKLSTARIQDAMDHCAQGEAVVLRAHGKKNVFLTGPLTLRPGVTLVVDKNTALVASRDPRVYDTTPGGCGIVSMHGGRACKPLISADGAKDSGIMGEGSIDARGGATLLGQDVTWWDLAHEAKVKDESQSVFAMIALRHVDGFILYKITLRNSPGFHVSINQTDGFTAWGVKIMTPKTARNTDGIDPGSSKNITIAYSYIHTGDDDVCLKPSGMGGVSNMSVLHNHFYSGHGMSIGSGTFGGVDHLLVDDLTIDGADNGIRIKSDRSRGGLVHQVVYRNVCIRNVPNPLVFTPHYTTFTGNRLPIYNDITLENVHVLTPGAYTFYGLDADPGHKLEIKLDNVFADDQKDSLFYDQDADITIGPHLGNLVPKGDDVTDTNAPDSTPGQPLDCDARFVPFPEDKTAPEMAGKIPPEDKTFYVAADGTGDYYSIQRALDMAPKTGGAVLSVSPGVYREVLTVDKPDITIRSANPDASKTVIVNDRSAGQNGGTLHSATVNVTADDFFAENITIENDFNNTHRADLARLAGPRHSRHRRPRHLPQRASARQSGHRLSRHALRHRRAKLRRHAPVLLRLLRRRQRRLHLRRQQGRLRELRDSLHPARRRLHHRAVQALSQAGLRLRLRPLPAHCRSRRHRPHLPRPPVASLRDRHLYAHRDGRQDRSRRMARMASRRKPLARNGLLRRIRLHRPRRASRSARSAHAFPHARRGQAIRAGNLPARHRQLGSDQAAHSARAVK